MASSSSRMFGLLVAQHAYEFQDCYSEIQGECDELQYRTPRNSVDILPVFLRLFSTGFPFILWCEFMHIARKKLAELKNPYGYTSNIWPTILRIAQISSEISDSRLPPPTIIRCGVTSDTDTFMWLNDMRLSMMQNDTLFSPFEISEMLSSLQLAFGNCVRDQLESPSLNPGGYEMIALQRAFGNCVCGDSLEEEVYQTHDEDNQE
jgi:hypothetical protein